MYIQERSQKTFINKALLELIARVRIMEADIAVLTNRKSIPLENQLALHHKLCRLTLLQHAVLTGILADFSCPKLAQVLQCRVTIIKATLDEALKTLNIRDRTTLLRKHINLLDCVRDKMYTEEYGLSKFWWLSPSPELLATIQQRMATASPEKASPRIKTRKAGV